MSKSLTEILEDEYPTEIKAQEIHILLLDKLSKSILEADDLPTLIDRFHKELKTL